MTKPAGNSKMNRTLVCTKLQQLAQFSGFECSAVKSFDQMAEPEDKCSPPTKKIPPVFFVAEQSTFISMNLVNQNKKARAGYEPARIGTTKLAVL